MDFPVVSGSIVLLRSCDWLGTFKNQGSSGYCNGGDWQGALWKRKNWARDYARGTGKRGYCIYKPSMQPALSSPSPYPASPPEGLRRRVERCPQRVLNAAVHFTACKAIISIPTSLAYPPTPHPFLLFPRLLSQLTFIWRVAPSTETLLICPCLYGGSVPKPLRPILLCCKASRASGYWIEKGK